MEKRRKLFSSIRRQPADDSEQLIDEDLLYQHHRHHHCNNNNNQANEKSPIAKPLNPTNWSFSGWLQERLAVVILACLLVFMLILIILVKWQQPDPNTKEYINQMRRDFDLKASDIEGGQHQHPITSEVVEDSNTHRRHPIDVQRFEPERQRIRHEPVVVKTECGTIAGSKEQGSFVFKGIPYAHPPQRWTSPTPKCTPSNHIRATKFGSPCFQVNAYTKQFEGREDCLTLNIWTPEISSFANRPVIVWLHGGFLQFGSSHQPGLRPSGRLSNHTGTVYVSLNYRLHVFGFLSLDEITKPPPSNNTNRFLGSPNFGLQDIIVALEWLQTNIIYFGGDPNNVMLVGPDGGADLILSLMTTPMAKGLFTSAWLIDPAVHFRLTPSEANRDNRKNFLARSGCQNLECLRRLPAKKIVEHFLGRHDPSFRINDQNDLPITGILPQQLITIDDITVYDSFPFGSKPLLNIPLLIGSAQQAVEFWPGPRDLAQWTWRDYIKYVSTSLDSFGPGLANEALKKYPAQDQNVNNSRNNNNSSNVTPLIQYTTMVSDLRQVCPITLLTEVLAKRIKAPVFRYLVGSRPSKPIRVYDYASEHSFHLWDAIAFFDSLDTFMKQPNSDDQRMKTVMQSIISRFQRLSNHDNQMTQANDMKNVTDPKRLNNKNLVTETEIDNQLWQPMPNQVAVISNERVDYQDNVKSGRCQFWQEQHLFNYVWTV